MERIVTGPHGGAGLPLWELRLGDWRDVLDDRPDVPSLSIVCDPPYSEATLRGQRSRRAKEGISAQVSCGAIAQDDAEALVQLARRMQARWLVSFGDHVSAEWVRLAAAQAGWRSFPPVPWIKQGAVPRLQGDGPSPQHETIAIARPRHRLRPEELHHRPGWYVGTARDPGRVMVGQKPLWLMRALVRSYSTHGALVVDPYAGSGTTLLAALMEGRRALGIEHNPATFEAAVERLRKGFMLDMFAAHVRRPPLTQLALH